MIRPVGDKILIKPHTLKEESVSASGIVYETQSSDSKETAKGDIVSVGENITLLKVGETVYYESHGAYKVNFEGEQYVLLNEINVLGVIDE